MSKKLNKTALRKMEVEAIASLAAQAWGVQLDTSVTKEELIDEVLSIQDNRGAPEIPEQPEQPAQAAAPTAPEPEPKSQAQRAAREKKYKLLIHEQEGPNGRDDVPVSVNGHAYQIKRDKEVIVPESVINVLKDAVMTVSEPGSDGKMADRSVRRFNFQCEPAA